MKSFIKILLMLNLLFSLGSFSMAMEDADSEESNNSDEMSCDSYGELESDEESEEEIKDSHYDEDQGLTDLHEAARDLDKKKVVELLFNRSDANAQCNQGKTPFDYVMSTIADKHAELEMHSNRKDSIKFYDKLRFRLNSDIRKGIEIAEILLIYMSHLKLQGAAYGLCVIYSHVVPSIVIKVFEKLKADDQCHNRPMIFVANDIAFNNSDLGVELIKILLKKGININEKDENGDPLAVAVLRKVHNKTMKVFELILQTNIDLNAIDAIGKTALDWCNKSCSESPEDKDCFDIREMILAKMA